MRHASGEDVHIRKRQNGRKLHHERALHMRNQQPGVPAYAGTPNMSGKQRTASGFVAPNIILTLRETPGLPSPAPIATVQTTPLKENLQRVVVDSLNHTIENLQRVVVEID